MTETTERPVLTVVKPKRQKRHYTQRQKLATVIAAELTSQTEAERTTGIPQETIRDWLNDPKYAEVRAKTREDLANELRAVAHLAIKRIAEQMPTMEARDAIFAMEKATELSQLVTGQATSRVETRELLNDFDDHETAAMQDWLRQLARERLAKEGMVAPDPA